MSTKGEQVKAARLEQLRLFVPEVFGTGTLLYIGASVRRAQCLEELVASGREITVLEVWPPNADHYRARTDLTVVCGDVRNVANLSLPHNNYDVAFWWHGPEHVPKEELPAVLADIEKRARLVVLACPWGMYPQQAIDGNMYEKHLSALGPENFQDLGYKTATLGKPGGRANSNIIAVKERMDILNLGAGNKLIEGAVNHDLYKHRPEIDVAHDLNIFPWPWPNEAFDQIVALSVFEHLDVDLVVTLNECHRLLRPGGTLAIKLPLWSAEQAHDDPTHRWYFTVRSLHQFCPETKRGRQYGFYTPYKWRYARQPHPNDARTSFYATLEVIK
jgi:hypothetical protein